MADYVSIPLRYGTTCIFYNEKSLLRETCVNSSQVRYNNEAGAKIREEMRSYGCVNSSQVRYNQRKSSRKTLDYCGGILITCQFLLGTVQQNMMKYFEVVENNVSIPLRYGTTFSESQSSTYIRSASVNSSQVRYNKDSDKDSTYSTITKCVNSSQVRYNVLTRWTTLRRITCQFLLGTVQHDDSKNEFRTNGPFVSIPLRYGTTYQSLCHRYRQKYCVNSSQVRYNIYRLRNLMK